MIEADTMPSGDDLLLKPTMASGSASDDDSSHINTLLTSISVVAQLAAMDTAEYLTTILWGESREDEDGEFTRLQHSLAEVEQQYGLTDTPLAKLTQSIHRFHSKCALLLKESDEQASEIASLQKLAMDTQARNRELEESVSALTEQNNKLAKKLKMKSKEKKCLAQHIKGFIRKAAVSEQQEKELEELKVAYKLQMHERNLLQANRNRTTSVDSNLSDGLDFLHSEDESEASATSLVTDGGVATLQLSPNMSSPRDRCFSETSYASFDGVSIPGFTTPKSPAPYVLTFSRGSKIGVRIRALPAEPNSRDDAITPTSLRPNEELTRAMVADGTEAIEESPTTEKPGSSHNPFAGLNFKMNFSFHSNNSQQQKNTSSGSHSHGDIKDKAETEVTRNIFVVSGYCDFDTRSNEKPPVGARIIAINNVPVPETCTLLELTESLKASSMADLLEEDGAAYSVTFRNDPLSRKQKQDLNSYAEATSSPDLNLPPSTQDQPNVLADDEPKAVTTGPSKTKTKDVPLDAKTTDAKLVPFNFNFMQRSHGSGKSKATDTPKTAECAGSHMSAQNGSTKAGDDSSQRESGKTAKSENMIRAPKVFPFWKSKQQDDLVECSSGDDSLL